LWLLFIYLFWVEIYCVITTGFWSRDGSKVVLLWSAYIHPRLVRGKVCGSCSRHRWEVWRTGQAGVFRKKTALEAKDEQRLVVPNGYQVANRGKRISGSMAGGALAAAVRAAEGCSGTAIEAG